MTTYPHLLRSSSQTLSLPGSPLSDIIPLLTEDEEYLSLHDKALIQDWEKENVYDSEDEHLIGEAQRVRSEAPGEPVRRLFKDRKPASCECGLFQPCQECQWFLTNESLAMGLRTHSKSPTISEEGSSPDSDSQESDLGLGPRDGRPDISCLQPLKVVTTGRIKNLLTSVKYLEQSTEYQESCMLMEDIIFTLSSTSSGSSSSKTATDSVWENRQATLVQSARLKLIATYYQLRAHPSTLGTTSASTETLYPKTARDHALEVLTSLETTCGLAAWLLQTKKSFLKTCKSILLETLCSSTSKSLRTPIRPTVNQSPRCRPLKKTESSFTGNGIRKSASGSSRVSMTPLRPYVRHREESPTLLKQKRKMLNGSAFIDLTESDPDDLSLSSSMGTLDWGRQSSRRT